MKVVPRILGVLAMALLLLWCIGILFSDQWVWSQWLAWIPTPLVILLLVISSSVYQTAKNKTSAIAVGVLSIALLAWFCFGENQLLRKRGPHGRVNIVGWTMSHSKKTIANESADIIVDLRGDITLLTHGWYVRGKPTIQEWLGESGYKVVNSQFTLFTKYLPLDVQTLIAADGIYLSSFVLDTTEDLGDVLVVWAIDLPSSVSRSKMDIAKRVRHLLDTVSATPPDLVIGDFNMTRNSSAIVYMFPELHDVADTAGVGLLASFPAPFPLYHIDHILMNAKFRATQYELINPHLGRHQIQVTEIEQIDRNVHTP
jgi:hypothetical protein